MPSGTPGLGYRSKAAFRLVGFYPSHLAYPTAIGTPIPDTLCTYDLIPFTKESIAAEIENQLNDVLNGSAGFNEMNQIGRRAAGNIELAGHYLGLNQLLAACMGYERPRKLGPLVVESPTYSKAGNAGSAIAGTVTSSGSNTLTDTGASFPTSIIGDFVRLEEGDDLEGSDPSIMDQVRRIIARPSTTQIQVTPDWADNPIATTPYKIARSFVHTYEMAKNIHVESLADFVSSLNNKDGYVFRWGVLGIDKGVSVWEWQACYIEGLSFKLDKEGVLITAEVRPFWKDLRTSGRNSNSSTWDYHAESYAITSRIRFADSVFKIGAHSSSDLGSGAILGITSLEFKISNGLQADLQTTASGLYCEEPARNTKRTVEGSFVVPRYVADTLYNNYTDGDLLMAQLTCTGPQIISTDYAKLNCFFRALKLKGAPVNVDGPGVIQQKIDFTCLAPPSASGSTWPTPSTGADNSELIIQTTDCNPFNYFMGQHADV